MAEKWRRNDNKEIHISARIFLPPPFFYSEHFRARRCLRLFPGLFCGGGIRFVLVLGEEIVQHSFELATGG